MNHSMDLDPLSTYEYPAFDSYHTLNTLQQYPYQNVKQETSYYHSPGLNDTDYNNSTPQTVPETQPTQVAKVETSPEEIEVKSSITKKKDKKNGKNFCSEKINDQSYPFYGCSVCNISYTALHELDQHVTVHKNRMTSYRLRLRNQYKKKQIKKEKKKLKKLKKIKQEPDLDVEIKPEDGYIGNEKATDYVNDNGTGTETVVNSDNGTGLVGNSDNGTGLVVNSDNGMGIVVNSDNGTGIGTTINNDNGTSIGMDKVERNNSNNNVNNSKCMESNEGNCMNDKDADETELNNLEKIYKCFACQKQFTLSYYLKLHVRSHTDEKPYTCNVCGQSFITASKLGRHNKRIHLAARFQCRICFKIFSKFELLTTHFDKSHAEDKLEGEPYDYNAILPYLKELEEQLKEQTEQKDEKKEDLWFDSAAPAPSTTNGVKEENQDEDQKLVPKIDIVVEEIKVDYLEVEVKIKQETEEGGSKPEVEPPGDEYRDDDDDVKDFKDDSFSDEDYFPSNTWAATPKCEPSPPPSPRRKKVTSFSRQCGVCHKAISSASYLRVHMRTHTGERPFKCYTCGRGFITSSKMNRHMLTHGPDAKQEEDIKQENAEVKEEDEVPTEEESTNSIKKKKVKRKLNKQAKGEDKKIRKKHQKRPHSCEYCNQKFLHLHMLEVHKKCHEGEALVFRCHFCLDEAMDEAALRDHEATHSGPKPYLCTICGKVYKKRETMVYHRKHHAPAQEYICDICSKRFSAACKLAKHLATHRREQFVLRYECPVCAHMFNTRYHVQMHLATHQKEGLILESNRAAVLAMVLQNALKIPRQPDAASLADITPSDERYRMCKICGETFHHFYYLEEHLKSHGSKIALDDTAQAEDKKYICPICHKGFKLHYYLKLHSFTHSKEKPFMCQQCGKGFITKGKLKRHLETHSGLKKYQCHICYKFFTRPSYLRIHIRTIHGTQDYNYRFDKSCMSLSAISALTQMSDSQTSV